jgi:hypothetical protein
MVSEAITHERVLLVRERRKPAQRSEPRGSAEHRGDCRCYEGANDVSSPVDADDFDAPDPDELLGGHPQYLASMQRLLTLSEDFQNLLDGAQRSRWLDLEDAILEHVRFVQGTSYQLGREHARKQSRRDRRAALLEILGSLIDHYSTSSE